MKTQREKKNNVLRNITREIVSQHQVFVNVTKCKEMTIDYIIFVTSKKQSAVLGTKILLQFTYTVMSCLSKLGTGVANSDVLMDGQKNRHWYFYFYVKHLQADGTTNAILHLLITYHDILEQLQLVHNTLLGLCNHCSDIDVLNVFLFPKGAVIVSVVHTKFDLCLFSCWRKPFLIRTVSVVCRFSSYFSKRLSNRHFFVGRSFFSFF